MSETVVGGASSPVSWGETLKTFLHPRVITMLFLGSRRGFRFC